MFAQTKLCLKFARSLDVLAHGVMVTLQFLVLAFKVRVLVGQLKYYLIPMSLDVGIFVLGIKLGREVNPERTLPAGRVVGSPSTLMQLVNFRFIRILLVSWTNTKHCLILSRNPFPPKNCLYPNFLSRVQ